MADFKREQIITLFNTYQITVAQESSLARWTARIETQLSDVQFRIEQTGKDKHEAICKVLEKMLLLRADIENVMDELSEIGIPGWKERHVVQRG